MSNELAPVMVPVETERLRQNQNRITIDAPVVETKQ